MFASVLVGSSPGSTIGDKVGIAALRALRTLLQGLAAAFGTGAAGSAILSKGYWITFGVACLGAGVTALASFVQNVASFLPEDPSQTKP